MLFVETVCKLMYDINHNLAPKNLIDLFTRVATVHSYHTKFSSAGNYQIKPSCTNQQQNAFSRVGAKIWSSVPVHLRNVNKKTFPEKIHTLLMDIMNREDSYVALPTILHRMSV